MLVHTPDNRVKKQKADISILPLYPQQHLHLKTKTANVVLTHTLSGLCRSVSLHFNH